MDDVLEFLEWWNIPYQQFHTHTASLAAPPKDAKAARLARTHLVKLDGRWCFVVVPVECTPNLQRLQAVSGAQTAELVSDVEARSRFPQFDPHAVPPLGCLFGLEVYVQRELLEDRDIVFFAGTDHDVMRIPREEYRRSIHPRCGNFTVPWRPSGPEQPTVAPH